MSLSLSLSLSGVLVFVGLLVSFRPMWFVCVTGAVVSCCNDAVFGCAVLCCASCRSIRFLFSGKFFSDCRFAEVRGSPFHHVVMKGARACLSVCLCTCVPKITRINRFIKRGGTRWDGMVAMEWCELVDGWNG